MPGMKNDPLLQELRDIRNEIAKECDYDVDKYFKMIKHRKKSHKNPIADIKPVHTFFGVAEKQDSFYEQ